MIDVIKEYLVSVGFDVNANSFNKANKQLNNFEKALGQFANTIAGKFTIAGAAVTTFSVVATAAIGKFAAEVAKADQEVEIFARRMLTTERNARSLKSVMDAMGLKDLEALKDVNLNPELRAQFLSLRRLTQTLEPGEDIQKSLASIRQIGYEFQKFQTIAYYSLQYIAGYLAKYLAKPLEELKKAMGGFNERFAKNIEKWSDRIAKLLAMVARMGIASLRLLELLNRVPDVIKQITFAVAALGAIIMAGPWGLIITALSGILLLADDYFGYKSGEKSALPGLWAGAENTFKTIMDILANIDMAVSSIAQKLLGKDWGQRAWNAIKGAVVGAGLGAAASSVIPGVGTAAGAIGGGVVGAITGAIQPVSKPKNHGNLTFNKGVHIPSHMREFLDGLAQSLHQTMNITSGIRPGNAKNKRSHASGNKVDIGLAGKSDSQILELMLALNARKDFVQGGLELGPKRYMTLINKFRKQGGDPSKFADFTSPNTTGPHIDVLKSPITINVYGNSDPDATADAVDHRLRTALATHNLQGFARA